MRVYRDDQKFLNFRINILLWANVIAFVFLAGSFWFVQGLQADRYRTLSEANALRQIVVPAKRGLIMDRNGKILADNQPAYALSVDRALMRKLSKSDAEHKTKLFAFLGEVLQVPVADVQARYDKGAAAAGGLTPVSIAEDLTMEQVASIQAQSPISFPEISVDPVQRRSYPYGTMAAHVMGFIGEATEKDLQTRKDLELGHLIGKRGVELMYDNYLRGKDGVQYWEYDSKGRRLGEYRPSRRDPVAGDNVYLTLDFELQRRAEQYFIENEFVGAAVALDPRNGEILALVSSPEFNPNMFSKRFTPDVYKTIASNPFKVELNRVVQGLCSPGSVFKTVMALGGLDSGAIDGGTTVDCHGTGVFFGRRFRCVSRTGHGTVDVERGLKVSCDIFFYNAGARMGIDKISEYAKELGFGNITQVDLDGEKAGIVPSTQWAATKQHRKWYPSETISVAIGQGPLVVTPLQVAVMMATIANGGTVYRPHVVRTIEHVDERGDVTRLKVASQPLRQVKMKPEVLEHVRNGLWKVVNEQGGTGGNARVSGLDISGKTGTVQVIAQSGWFSTAGLPFMQRDHAWFASYAKKDEPDMVVVVFVEHAGAHGGTDSAPLAKMLYEARFQDQLTNARLNLSNRETLDALKEGRFPQPGVAPREPARNDPGLGH